MHLSYVPMGWDSAVGIATCYGLDGPGIESWCGRDLPHPSRLAVGSTQPPIQWVPSLSWGKAAGATLATHSHLAPRLKKEQSCTSTPPLGLHGLL